jgi:hypothetical protein
MPSSVTRAIIRHAGEMLRHSHKSGQALDLFDGNNNWAGRGPSP